MIKLDMFELLFFFVESRCKIKDGFVAVVISFGKTDESALISHENGCKLS